jgi:hypothetical protein
MIEISGLGLEGEVRKTLWTKLATVGPTRTARVLAMMRATFLGIVVAIVDFWLVLQLVCVVGEKEDNIEGRDSSDWIFNRHKKR